MTMNPDWQISPCLGLGPLRLGMSMKDVEAFDTIFGPVKRRIDDGQAAEAVIRTLEPFAESVPAIRENIAQMRAQSVGVITEHRSLKAPILKYRQDKLIEIILPGDCRETSLAGRLLFAPDSQATAAHLAGQSGETRFLTPELMFPSLCLLLLEFATRNDKGEILFSQVPANRKDNRIVKLVEKSNIQANADKYAVLIL